LVSPNAGATAAHSQDIVIVPLGSGEIGLVEELHALVFGPGRFSRAAYRVREGTPPVSRHCRVAWRGTEFIGSVSMTAITVGSAPGHWLLGPVAVKYAEMNKKFGHQLVQCALDSVARDEPESATVILVGDAAYYNRFGFAAVPRGRILMPGPVDPARLLIWTGPEGKRDVPNGLMRASE
jgi:predicted N-acetyltransferase YhbS